MKRKYKAIKDKKISGMAGPVIRATGIKISNNENISTSNDTALSKKRDLKGINAKFSIFDTLYIVQRI